MKICLITNTHISYNPRLLKEADALFQAGHDVRVIAISNSLERMGDDEKLMKTRQWNCVRLDFSCDNLKGKFRWMKSGIRSKAFQQLSTYSFRFDIAELSFCRYLPETLSAAINKPADLYIAHNLQALAVAARAAAITKGLLGFDVEDFHIEEDSSVTTDPLTERIKHHIMSKYIQSCDYVSAASESMASALVESFNIQRPNVLYNVFPLSYSSTTMAPNYTLPEQNNRSDKCYTAYWFSQVISLDRGLQDFIRAMPMLTKSVKLHLRGNISEDVKNTLLALAKDHNLVDAIHFHPLIYAEDLVQDAAKYDFGLALEQPVSRNRLITVTNKLFVYLLAGNAIIATATPGQKEILDKMPDIGIQYDAGDCENLAKQINLMFHKKEVLITRQRSWNVGQKVFNWDIEKEKLTTAIKALEKRQVLE